MKKVLTLVLVVVLVISLAACGGSETPVGDVSEPDVSQSEPEVSSDVSLESDEGSDDNANVEDSLALPVYSIPEVRALQEGEVAGLLDLMLPYNRVVNWDEYEQGIVSEFLSGHPDWEGNVWYDGETVRQTDDGQSIESIVLVYNGADMDCEVDVAIEHREADQHQLAYGHLKMPITAGVDEVVSVLEDVFGHLDMGWDFMKQYIVSAKAVEGQEDDYKVFIQVGENAFWRIEGSGYGDSLYVTFDMYDNLDNAWSSVSRIGWQNWMPAIEKY